MKETSIPKVRAAIVDYGLGNLFSIQRACEHAGMEGLVTSEKREILGSDLVILPGVGAFGDAMRTLLRLDLVSILRDVAASDKPLIGICLGIQLLMTESYEFGLHKGLGIIDGSVIRFQNSREAGHVLKVPQVQWNRIFRPQDYRPESDLWVATALSGLADGEFMYFVHSFYVCPADPSVVLSASRYGDVEFCSTLLRRNVFACQFHPERSGLAGLQVYHNLARMVATRKTKSAA